MTAFDVNEAATQKLVQLGAKASRTAGGVAVGADVVVTMVPSTPHSQLVYAGAGGIFSTMRAGALLIDASTIDPQASRALAKEASAKGAKFLDAPVSGGTCINHQRKRENSRSIFVFVG